MTLGYCKPLNFLSNFHSYYRSAYSSSFVKKSFKS